MESASLGRILVVDDESQLVAVLDQGLTAAGYVVHGYTEPESALAALRTEPHDILLSDLMMPAMDGINLLRTGLEIDPNLVGLIMTGQGTVQTAVEAMKVGAYDYILKPFKLQAILPTLARAMDLRRLRTENLQLRETVAIYELSEVIALTVESDAILANTIDVVVQLINADEVSIMLLSPAGDELVVEAVRGAGRDWLLGRHVPLDLGIAGWVAREQLPVVLRGDVSDPRFCPLQAREEINSAISVPMLAAGKLVGVLNANSLHPPQFTTGQAKALRILANTAAAALDNARLYARLTANERRFRALIEHSSDAISLLGPDGRLVYASPSTTRILGYDNQQIIGVDPATLIHPDDLPGLLELLADLMRTPSGSVTAQYRFRHQDGTWRWIEASINNLLGEPAVGALVFNYRDITERKEASQALTQAHDLLTRAEQIGQIGSWDWEIANDRVIWSVGMNRLFGLVPGEFEATFAGHLSRVHPDDREEVHQLIENGCRQLRPFEFENRIVWPNGSVRVQYTRAEALREPGRDIAHLTGIAIDITERKQRERELEAIAATSAALRSADTQAQMLPIILEQVVGLLGATAAAVALRDTATGDLIIVQGHGEMADLAGERWPAGAGIGGQVAATGEPFVSEAILADWAAQSRAVACVPLITRQLALGVLWAGRVTPFIGAEVRVLSAIADMAANAIQRLALFEQTERQLKRLLALRAIDQAISSSLDLQLTLRVLLDQVTSQLHVDAADILLYNPHTLELSRVIGRGLPADTMPQAPIRLGEGLTGRAALERRMVHVPDLGALERPFPRTGLLAENHFVCYYAVPLIAKAEIKGVLEVFHGARLEPDHDWLEFLNALSSQAAIAIENAQLFEGLQRSNVELAQAYDATIEGWSAALDLRDKETEGHSQRVMDVTVRLARAMGMQEPELTHVRRGALLHDIGKMGVPDQILLKPGPLTDEEWALMRQHPQLAHQLLSPIPFLRPALDIPYCHHERWDGTGYPRKLAGEAIPLAARVFAVVDVWDALRSDRPYRAAWPIEKVREHIRSLAGSQFDPSVVEAFLALDI